MEVIKRKNRVGEMFGKVPPQSKEIEGALLGAIMLEKRAFSLVSEIISAEAFYVEAHQRIFEAMSAMSKRNMPIEILTVVEELKKSEELDLVGGAFYVMKLTNSVFSTASIETHARLIMEKFILREIIRIGGELVSEGYEDKTDVFELLDKVEASVFSLTTNYIKKDYSHISKGLAKVVDRIEHLRLMDETVTGVHSGFTILDSITHGWQPSDLIVIAARPSVGKTAFALNLARNSAMHPKKPVPVGFFSLEMSEGQLITRILSIESNIWLKSLKTGRLEDSQVKTLYEKGVNPLIQAPIFIDDTAALTIFELRSKARRMKDKHGVGLIIIDYLQLMSGDSKNSRNGNREQEISKISRDLKKIAKELDIPIIALSQLSREVEKRGKGQKVPQLSDLRESGAIEQDADLVAFLYRPPEDEVKEDAALANTGMVKIAKHRNGELGEIIFEVNNNVQQWKEKEESLKLDFPKNLIPVKQADKIQQQYWFSKDNQDEEVPF